APRPVTTTRRRAGGCILERLKTSASYGGVGEWSPLARIGGALALTRRGGYNQGLSATKGVGHYSITEGTL
ncbi:MAG: hypothetical protein WA668_05900, partial [Candidatus Cybelea sp.]